MPNSNEVIGFVGVGLMGHGMATNILAGGYKLCVVAHNNRAPVEDLIRKGAIEAPSLDAIGEMSDVVFICAPGSPQVEAIVADLAKSLKPGSVIVDCSTSDPTSTVKLAADLKEFGINLADAPLGGTPAQAASGELHAMVGADDSEFSRLKPIIQTWAGKIVHIGQTGDGHKMKLLNNFLSLGYAAIYSEALALGKKSGLSPETFDSIIRGSRMDCGFYQTFMGYMIEGNPESHKFTLANAYKDLRYLASMADAENIQNPIGNAVKNSFAAAFAGGGDGPTDFVPTLPEYVGRANGVDLKPSKLKT